MCLTRGDEGRATSLQFTVDGRSRDAEQLSFLRLGVLAAVVKFVEKGALSLRRFGCLPLSLPLARATASLLGCA